MFCTIIRKVYKGLCILIFRKNGQDRGKRWKGVYLNGG